MRSNRQARTGIWGGVRAVEYYIQYKGFYFVHNRRHQEFFSRKHVWICISQRWVWFLSTSYYEENHKRQWDLFATEVVKKKLEQLQWKQKVKNSLRTCLQMRNREPEWQPQQLCRTENWNNHHCSFIQLQTHGVLGLNGPFFSIITMCCGHWPIQRLSPTSVLHRNSRAQPIIKRNLNSFPQRRHHLTIICVLKSMEQFAFLP